MRVAIIEPVQLWAEAIHAVISSLHGVTSVEIHPVPAADGYDTVNVEIVRSSESTRVQAQQTVRRVTLSGAPEAGLDAWLQLQLNGTTTTAPRNKPQWAPPRVELQPPSARELAVLRGLAAGQTTKQIATELRVAPTTVASHRRKVYQRWGVHSAAEAVAAARRVGLLTTVSSPLSAQGPKVE